MPRAAEGTSSLQVQKLLRREVVRVLGREAVKAYHRPSTPRTLATLAHVWLAVAAGFVAAGWIVQLPLGWALLAGLPLVLFMGTRINAMNVMVHEGSHHALARSRRLNAWLTNVGFGYWILFDADSYRAVHMKHHRFLNERADPDRPLYELPGGRNELLRGLLADLSWVSVLRRALVYARRGAADAPAQTPVAWPRRLGHFAGKGICNASLLGAQVVLHGPWLGLLVYGVFWVVPLFSVYPMIIRLRVVAEHFAPQPGDALLSTRAGEDAREGQREAVPSRPVAPRFVARSTVCGPLEHYLLGAQMEMHFEHHLFPGVPYAQAKRMHAALVRAGFFDESGVVDAAHALTGGYMRFWSRLLRGKLGTPFVAGGLDAEALAK